MGVLPVQDVKPSFTTEEYQKLVTPSFRPVFLELVLCVYTYKQQLYYVYIVKKLIWM